MEDKELIWVSKKFAEKFKGIDKEEEKTKTLNEYLESVKFDVREEFRVNLENLQEDAAIFSGLMLQVKKTFEKIKQEHFTSSYELWEKFEKEIPSTQKKAEKIVAILEPITKELIKIDSLLISLRTFEMDHVFESVQKFISLYGEGKEMFEFLVKNFKRNK